MRTHIIGMIQWAERISKPRQPPFVIAPVFWAWAQQQAASEEPLHLTRRRAIQMQLQADADHDLAKAVCEKLEERNIPFVIYNGYGKLEGPCSEGELVNQHIRMCS